MADEITYDAEWSKPVTLKKQPEPYVFRDGRGLVADISQEIAESGLDGKALAAALRAIGISEYDALRFVQVYDSAHQFYMRGYSNG